jgi:hypothetical protein
LLFLFVLVCSDGTGTEEIANYDYEVRVNHEVIERGRVQDHHRKDGWRALIGAIVDKYPDSIAELMEK